MVEQPGALPVRKEVGSAGVVRGCTSSRTRSGRQHGWRVELQGIMAVEAHGVQLEFARPVGAGKVAGRDPAARWRAQPLSV